tara:strand:+ start:13743 stop:14228 length:486 start_codon:yes stop_codon:yes gene_type:complete
MFSDPQFWVLIAFIIFIAAIFNPVRKMVLANLDNKINEISNNIEQAENLKKEAQQTLSDIKKRQNEVKNEIKSIHSEAQQKITNIEKNAELEIKELVQKKYDIFDSKVEQLVREANAEIKKTISQKTINAITMIFSNNLSEENRQKLINQSLTELQSSLKN